PYIRGLPPQRSPGGPPADHADGQARDLPVLAHEGSAHAMVLRPRRAPDSSRVTLPAVLPSAFNRAWAPWFSAFRGSIARPARTPVNASPRPSQDAAHDSGPPWVR